MSENSLVELINKTLKGLNIQIIKKLHEWGKIVQLRIDEVDYFINFSNENLILKEGLNTSYDFKISSSADIFLQIINNELNPVEAVVSGDVAIEGSLTDALEFSEMMTNA